MSNIMQYMVNQTDEFRDAYAEIIEKIDAVIDRMSLLELRLLDVEVRVNQNRNTE
tara:strand:- start:1214 stop:1378 length:165 start_codon:yes stop_codon:yes gene_type:complete